MKKRIAILPIVVLLCIASCGVKNGYVTGQYGKHPLNGHTISETDTANKPTLGLFWQADSLRITLNQGRQLLRARSTKDTLYLYEAPRDTVGTANRQYSVYIPQHELHIIKYNDSLVYPIMPMTEPCEYPLDIEGMGAKNVKKYNEAMQKAQEQSKETGLYGGAINENIIPIELQAGTYVYNAGLYRFGSDCECTVDSSKMLVLYTNGTWLQYDNEVIQNCGIMRRNKSCQTYEAFSYKGLVFIEDTASFYFPEYEERKRKRKEGLSMNPNEYSFIGKSHKHILLLVPCKRDSTMHHYFNFDNSLMLEGSTCGWQRISKDK